MSYILLHKPALYVDKKLSSLNGIQEDIREHENTINDAKTKLKMLAIANVKDLAKDEDPIYYADSQVDDLVEDIIIQASDIKELTQAEELIDCWKYRIEDDDERIDTDTKEGFAKVVVDEDQYFRKSPRYDAKNPLQIKSFDTFNSYLDTFQEAYEIPESKDRFVIYINNKLYVDEYQRFTYSTYEAAKKVVEEDILHIDGLVDIVSNKYINEHPQFFDDIVELYKKEPTISEAEVQRLIADIETIKNEKFDHVAMSRVYDIIKELVFDSFKNIEIKRI